MEPRQVDTNEYIEGCTDKAGVEGRGYGEKSKTQSGGK